MSGRDHHYIPQLLQKGFSAGRTKAGQHQIWVFRRNTQPFATNTRNSFVEKDFYGPPDDTSLDDAITSEELGIDRFLSDARGVASSQYLQSGARAAAVVWHIGLRARCMRDLLTTFSHMAIQRLRAAMNERSTLPQILRTALTHESKWLIETMLREASKRTGGLLSAEQSAQVVEFAKHIQSHPEVLAEFIDAEGLIEHAEQMQDAARPAAERAHRHFLQKHLLARRTGLQQYLQGMKWEIVVSESPELVLGDCGPMTVAATGEPVGPLGTHEFRDWSGIVLPISSSHYLIGTHTPLSATLSAASLNESTAAWSSEAFIARTNTVDNRKLHALIKSRVESYLLAEAEAAFRENGL